jgi:hypothetical protein
MPELVKVPEIIVDALLLMPEDTPVVVKYAVKSLSLPTTSTITSSLPDWLSPLFS